MIFFAFFQVEVSGPVLIRHNNVLKFEHEAFSGIRCKDSSALQNNTIFVNLKFFDNHNVSSIFSKSCGTPHQVSSCKCI